MKLRNIKRFLFTPKVLNKHNKAAKFELTGRRLTILSFIYLMETEGLKTHIKAIRLQLNKNGKFEDWLNLSRCIDELTQANYIKKDGYQYFTTIEGRYILQTIEDRLKVERFDR